MSNDAVRDGRQLMANDGHLEPPFVSLAEHYVPEHPNYRYQVTE